LKLNT